MAWGRGSRTCRASHNSARCFARLRVSRGDMYDGGKKGALHIEESPGPFNTIRTSGYHHGLFDSPFYQTSRNVFFLLRLFFSSALLVPSIHPSLVRTTRLFLPLMANRMFLDAVELRFLILHEFVSHREELLSRLRIVVSFYVNAPSLGLNPDLIRLDVTFRRSVFNFQ